ncbi:MAG: PCMD domain-containing protein, partial [Duncaniella sp.]|nr:PCMD domain-containing protein [Duncaniella sp.]
ALYMAGALMLGSVMTGCRDEHLLGEGEGKMMLETSILSDVKVVSRALSAEQQAEMANSALIWISDPAKGLLYKYDGIGSFPAEGLPLVSGHYAAEAWVGDSVPASWDKKRYRGYEPFEISRGQLTSVQLKCPIRNTVVSVRYGEQVSEVLTDLSLTVSLNDGVTDGSHGLTFEGLEPARGYYMINSRTDGFVWTLSGKQLDGKEFKKSGEYKDPSFSAKPYLAQTTEYIFNIKYDINGEIEVGGAYFSIDVEPEPVEGTEEEVIVALAPEIAGSGFDITAPIAFEPGNATRFAVNIIGSTALKSVELNGDLLAALGLPHSDYDLIGMSEADAQAVAAAGIMIQTFASEDNASAVSNMRLIFDEEGLNRATKGEYTLQIKAVDANDQETVKTIAVSVTDAPVIIGETPSVDAATLTFTTATLSVTVKDASAHTTLGFEVKKTAGRAYEDWTFVQGVVDGTAMTAELTDLEDGATYAWRAVADDFKSKEFSFTTPAYPQLPNAGFETYYEDSKNGFCFYDKDDATPFWGSGNPGAMSLKQNITYPDQTVKHSGNNSVLLESKRPSLFGVGKFAAGNIFAGKYLDTDGTDGVLGWGREWTIAPKALKGWAKYSPKTIDTNDVPDGLPNEYKKGNPDKGIVYVAILSEGTESYTIKKGDDKGKTVNYPVIIKTKKDERKLFDKNAANVLGYGEVVFSEATPGDGMVEFTVNIEKMKEGTPAYIMVVASASKGGDYFAGGVGSKLWLDDLELVY